MTAYLKDRRAFLSLLTGISVVAIGAPVHASEQTITFDELYGTVSVLGLTFSDKVKELSGKKVSMSGFMAPPLKAEFNFFVLTEVPLSICPFCSSDADWPEDIVVIYLNSAQTFEQANGTIEVSGTLEVGSWTDPETGFVSLLRIVDAQLNAA